MINKSYRIIIDARMINNSGIGRYTKELINAVKKTYTDVKLIYNDDSKNINEIYDLKLIRFKSPIYSLKEHFEFLTKVPSCDLFISPHYNVPLFLPRAKKRMVIIPDVNHLVFNEGFSFFKKAYANFFYYWAVNKSNSVFTISNFSKNEIIKYTKCNPQNIQVSLLSIDKEYFIKQRQANISNSVASNYDSMKYLLFVGNVKPHKNIKRSLLAFKKVLNFYPDLKFVIVGKKEKLLNGDDEVIDMVRNNSSEFNGNVIFTGHISDSELAKIYVNAVCLVFASLYEGFGIPPLEAMIFNCPVICSTEGSLPEICGDAVLYCNAYSIDDIAEKIKTLIENKTVREQLIKKGELRLEKFDWNNFSDEMISAIKFELEKV